MFGFGYQDLLIVLVVGVAALFTYFCSAIARKHGAHSVLWPLLGFIGGLASLFTWFITGLIAVVITYLVTKPTGPAVNR